MSVPKECASCNRLRECNEVTEKKILDKYCCRIWQTVSFAAWEARCDIIQNLGPWALRYEVLYLQQSVRPKSRRRKKHV